MVCIYTHAVIRNGGAVKQSFSRFAVAKASTDASKFGHKSTCTCYIFGLESSHVKVRDPNTSSNYVGLI